MRVVVTGSGGRLGRALMAAFSETAISGPAGPRGWDVPDYQLDDPDSAERHVARDRPDVVIHTAAWTDVDGCAREPTLALRRNGAATGELAAACVRHGADLVVISTNEVFDGRRTDGRGYTPGDPTGPINAYGRSKLAGEEAARAAFEVGAPGTMVAATDRRPQLGIVRTAWLFGPPGGDFPAKILAAAERARAAGEPLRVVRDEIGAPTYTLDLAAAVVELVEAGAARGVHHLVNAGRVSRAGWAAEVLRGAGIAVTLEEVAADAWPRPSTPPAWGVLEPTPLPGGEPLRSWQEALADYLPALLRSAAT